MLARGFHASAARVWYSYFPWLCNMITPSAESQCRITVVASFSCSRHWDKRSGALLRRVIRLSPDLQKEFQITWEAFQDGWSRVFLSVLFFCLLRCLPCMSSSLKPSQKLPLSPESGSIMWPSDGVCCLATNLTCQDRQIRKASFN